jgi:nucleoside-diphosphate-sugar epimerase
VSLLDKLNENQTLIYAGSGSVYGDCKVENATEDYQFESPYNMYDLTKQMIDSYVLTSKVKPRVFGLRFGTVNGSSPVLRTDVMLNAMTNSAKTQNKVLLFNPETKRSILGTVDLCRAFKTIIDSNKSTGGIYNLCSFTKTSGEMAKIVSNLCKVTLETVIPDEVNKTGLNEKLVSSKYNFALSTNKFTTDFNFQFEETAESIVDNLIMNWDYMVKGHRNKSFNYEKSNVV